MSDRAFPQRLISAAPDERFAYFHNWRVVHPKLVQAKDELLQAIRYAGDRRLIHLVGCTGVGKTTLRKWVEYLLLEEHRAEMTEDPDRLPIASVVTPAPDQGPFNWRDVYIQTMHALGEPKSLTTRKDPRPIPFTAAAKLAIAPTLPRQELRLALTGCLHMRRVQVLFYDDAQHFQMVTKAQRLQDQMDNLKWLSDATGVRLVLVGTYDLLNLLDLSGQLARRSATIHFARYHADEPTEFKQFAGVVYAFQQHVPLAEEVNLIDHCAEIYAHCLGCIGLLKEGLERALAQALANGAERLPENWWEQCTEVRSLVAVAKEAIVGEQRLCGSETLAAEWQGLRKSVARMPTTEKRSTPTVAQALAPRQPGQRAARRDPVGSAMGASDA
jgi:hypothetical protein